MRLTVQLELPPEVTQLIKKLGEDIQVELKAKPKEG